MNKSNKSKRSIDRRKILAANRQRDPLESILSNDVFQNPSSADFVFECRRFRDFPPTIQGRAFELLTENMRAMYERSTWGWRPRKKLAELKASNAWCLLIKTKSKSESTSLESKSLELGSSSNSKSPDSAASNSSIQIADQNEDAQEIGEETEEEIDERLVGFSHFRYDLDYGLPVVYCYEIQIDVEFRNRGIGRTILEILRLLGREARMRKVVATIFKHNEASRRFFERAGFTLDESSPDEEDEDYVVVSSSTSEKIEG